MVTKRALVVGIDDYSRWPEFDSLTCCVHDARSVEQLLINGFNVAPSEITLYCNEEATRRSILSALNLIISQSKAGDVVFFYFSGHGDQVGTDPERGDCDSYYEAIVPYDRTGPHKHSSYITDFNFARSILGALEPSYVNLTVMLDSCHSGGIHRTDELQKCKYVVKTKEVLQQIVDSMKTLIPCGVCLEEPLDALKNNVCNLRITDKGMIDLDEAPDKTLVKQSKSTLISACHFDEYAYEGKNEVKHSILTQALLDHIDQRCLQITYHELFDEVSARVAEYMKKLYPGLTQTPQLRGQMNRMEEDFLEGWIECK